MRSRSRLWQCSHRDSILKPQCRLHRLNSYADSLFQRNWALGSKPSFPYSFIAATSTAGTDRVTRSISFCLNSSNNDVSNDVAIPCRLYLLSTSSVSIDANFLDFHLLWSELGGTQSLPYMD